MLLLPLFDVSELIRPELGYFEIRPQAGAVTRVYIPDNPSQGAEERIRELRVSDFVRIEGAYIGDRRFHLDAFL